MTDFRINVIIDPKGATQGSKAVERQLGRVESKANKVQGALRKAFAGLSFALAIREITQFADTFTDLQNRLRLLVPQERLLVKTTRDLLKVSNDTRTAFEGTVILYQRLGLATRELGIDGGDLIGVVKSINQALILSGASAKEANNGLIQLSQGIASNRLGGDELRSTLEQLPAVADVIAKELGVTRGKLREMGSEGKITGEIIIEAFRNAKDELENKFGQTVPTLSQSFTVLKNNLTVFFGELNSGTGALRGVGAAVRFLGENVEALSRTLVVLGSTFAALRLAPTIQAFFELRAAAKAGRVVILGSAEAARQKAIFDRDQAAAALTAAGAEVQKAKATIASTDADVAATASTARRLVAEKSLIDVQAFGATTNLRLAQTGLVQAQADRANIATTGTLADLRARIAIADANVAGARKGVQVATEQAAAAEARLAAATSATARASEAAFGAEVRLAKAHESAAAAASAQATAEARLATTTAAAYTQANFLTRSLGKVRAALLAVNAAIVANPIGVVVVAVVAAVAALVVFRDKIKLATDGVATLGDTFRLVGRVIGRGLRAVGEKVSVLERKLRLVSQLVFGKIDLSFKKVVVGINEGVDVLVGVFVAFFRFLESLVANVPGMFDRAFRKSINLVIAAIEVLPRTLLAVVTTLGGILGDFLGGVLDAVTKGGEAIDALFDRDFSEAKRLALEAGKAVAEGMEEATSGVGERFQDNFEENLFNGLVPRLAEPAGKTFGEIGDEAAEAFSTAFTDFNFFRDGALLFFDQAEFIAEEREAAAAIAKTNEERNKAVKLEEERAEAVEKATKSLKDQQAILTTTLRSGRLEADIQRELLELRNELAEAGKPDLTPAQAADIERLVRRNDLLRQFVDLQEDLISPQEKLADRTELLSVALLAGVITLDQYLEGLRRVANQLAELSGEEPAAEVEELSKAFEKRTKVLRDQQTVLATSIAQGKLEAQVKREILAVNTQLAQAGEASLTPDQENDIASIIKRNDLLTQFAALQEELITPQEQLADRTRLLTLAVFNGVISYQQYIEQLAKVKEAQDELNFDDRAAQIDKVTQSLQAQQAVLTTTIASGQLQANIQRELIALRAQLADANMTPLTDAQEAEIAALITRNDQLRKYIELQNELVPPMETLIEKEELIRQAFAEGVISLNEYEQALQKVRIEQAELGTTVSDGLVTGMQKVGEQLNDVASLAENAFVSAFSSAENALVSFATEGSVSFKEFANAIIKDILRIIARMLLLRALGGFFAPGFGDAAPGGGTVLGPGVGDLNGPAGSFGASFPNLPQAATGSSMALANQPFIIGEEGPELFTPGQTGSITPTDQTIAALASASSAQGQTTVVQAPAPEVNVQVVNVDSPDAARSAMDTDDGAQVIINQIRRNRSAIKQELGVLG